MYRNDLHLWLASLDWLHTYQGLLWTDWSTKYRIIVEKQMTIYIKLLTDSKYNKNATSAISEMVSERSNSFVRKFRTRPARSRYRNVGTPEGLESQVVSPRWGQTSTAVDWRRITSRQTWRLAFNTYMVSCQKPLGLVDIGKLNITKSPAESFQSFQCRMTWSACFELSLEKQKGALSKERSTARERFVDTAAVSVKALSCVRKNYLNLILFPFVFSILNLLLLIRQM